MNFANDVLDAIEIMVKQVVEDNATKIYTGVCKTIGTGNCVLTINGKDNTVKYYGGVPVVGTVYQVFIPFGNMSAAFIIVPGSGGESGGSGVDSVNGMTGDVVLNAADVGLSNVDNIKQYSESNPPPYPVVSVNGKIGDVNLIASDVGAAPAGYGLGTTGASINSGKDLNDIWQCGFYSWDSGVSNAPFSFGLMVVLSPGAYADGRVQIAYDRVNKTIAIRWLNTTWSPWEYQNPPMVVGKEYRTTERYQGKPVYTMMLPSVALGSAGSTAYIEGLANIKDIIDYRIQFQYASTSQTFAVNNWNKVKVAMHYDSGYAFASIDCIEDCSNNKATGTFKYTKTTD